MVSGFVTSPWDQLRIFSGEARLMRIASKSAIGFARSNGLERNKVSSTSCGLIAAASGSGKSDQWPVASDHILGRHLWSKNVGRFLQNLWSGSGQSLITSHCPLVNRLPAARRVYAPPRIHL